MKFGLKIAKQNPYEKTIKSRPIKASLFLHTDLVDPAVLTYQNPTISSKNSPSDRYLCKKYALIKGAFFTAFSVLNQYL